MKTDMYWDGGTAVTLIQGGFRSADIRKLPQLPGYDGRFRVELKDTRGIYPFPNEPKRDLMFWDVRADSFAEGIVVGRAWVEGE